MDDSRPLVLAAGGAVREDPMDERSGRVAGRRVDDDAGRLVDDEQVLVLVWNAEIDLLRRELRRGRGRLEFDVLPAPQAPALR